ncbi:Glycosyltransferase Family 2 protein [Glomus cerebriforme]|uniref:chitin synthase n=1 Tax=Glomus cerebriforme TaxID=658196 RepID=A0A397SF03_9GLOM|nr:Glycosyltransferase Family 2 protein [Glomus cerebriforme]
MDEFYKPPYTAPPSSMIPPTRTPPPSSNAPLNPSTAIFNAVLQNNVGLVRSILNQTQFNPNNLRNKDGKTPLMVAACENCPDVVKYLVTLPNVNIDLQDIEGESALYQAASMGQVEVVDILIYANANVESYNNENITPLIIAAYHGHADVCRVLIDHGHANINFQDKSHKTALSLTCYEGHIEVAKILLVRGANVDITDQYGWTALMFAAFNGHAEVCQLLLEYNSDSLIKTSNGKTAVTLAKDAKHSHVSNLIENYNKNNNINNNIINNNDNSNYYNGYNGKNKNDNNYYNNNGNNNGNNNYNNNHNHNYGNYYNKPTLPSPPPPPPHRSRQAPFQRTPERFPTAIAQQQIESNFTNQNFYPQIPINNTKGYLMPLNRSDSRRTKLQRKRPEQFRIIPETKTTNGEKFYAKTVPYFKNDMAPREDKTPWVIFSLIVTACFCNPCLSIIGKMKEPNVRQAWREKVALVIIIILISLFMGFLAFGLATVTCGIRKPTLYKEDVFEKFGPNQPNRKVHIIHGKIYDTGVYILFGSHRPLTPPITDEQLLPIIYPTFGQDISDYFPIDSKANGCPFSPKNNGPICDQAIKTKNPLLHCHTSINSILKLKDLDLNEPVVYSWENITQANTTLFVYSNSVYDIGKYLDPSNEDKWLGDDSVTNWLKSLLGKDSTREIANRGNDIAKCLPNFKVGEIEGTTIGCFANKLIIIIMTVVFTGISLIKFISAVAFDWLLSWQLGKLSKKQKTDDTTSHILLLVTCYSEGESSVRTTLDSLASTDYSDKHKLLFIIADGDITGSENERSTPQICKDLIEPFDLSNFDPPIPKSYLAIGDGKKQHNMAEVIIGYYNCKGHRVPICLINKVGTPEERRGPKAGNRGKRDSQLILMKWLSNICFNERMTPLEFELFEKVRTLTGVTPDKYEMVLMVDADTLVMKDSVSRMVAAMERDPTVMGLCGETKIVNKTTNWVTMIQVFEYYISHHLGKSFESMFGGVTCLPGCFCMYRIKAPKYDGYSVPILANPDIVELYSSNTVETLHQKNLLLLGEDRYLTTLMLRTYPKRKMIYVPKAICKTVVPDEFRVLLSQRRRWINSTIHNLMELILVPQLCGIFCCSMQFVIFLELIGTVVLPSSLIFMIYLIIVSISGVNVVLPLIFIAATFFLQVFLVIFTSHKISYIMWMFIFILAMPIWNFILPIYAFWHFDDFSWGATRKIAGKDNGHGGNKSDEFERNQIPRKKWIEWKVDDDDDKDEKDYSSYSPQLNQDQRIQYNNSQQTLPGGFPSFKEDLPTIPNNSNNSNNYNNDNISNFYNNFNNNDNYNDNYDNYNNNNDNNGGQNIIGTRPMGPRSPNNPTGPRKFDIIRY